ncbi:hypothetical protein DPQ22_09470 [Candidatus Tokpelaia sp.]|nr:hypothetical protein DPQ22_09470 [Candidatus Tokpelaia sp.]
MGDEGEDPFVESREIQFANIKVSYFSGLFLSCREGKSILLVKAISPFNFADMPKSYPYKMSFAVDGDILFKDREALLSSNPYGKVASYTILDGDVAQNVAQKFSEARKSVAVRDGIGAGTEIHSARGASSAGRKLLKCLLK